MSCHSLHRNDPSPHLGPTGNNFSISPLSLLRAMASTSSVPANGGDADRQWANDQYQYDENTWQEQGQGNQYGQWKQRGQAEGQPEEHRSQWEQGGWQQAYEVHGQNAQSGWQQQQGQGDWEYRTWQQQEQSDWSTEHVHHWKEQHGGQDVGQCGEQWVPQNQWAEGAYGSHSHNTKTQDAHGGDDGDQKQPSQDQQHLHAHGEATSAHSDHNPSHLDGDASDKAKGCGPFGLSGPGAQEYDWNPSPGLRTCWTGPVTSMQPWERKFRCAGIIPNVGRHWFNNKSNQPAFRHESYYQPPAFVMSTMGPIQYNQVLIPVPVPNLPMMAAAMHVPPTPPKAAVKKNPEDDMESVLEEPLYPDHPEQHQQQTWTPEQVAAWHDEQKWMKRVQEQEQDTQTNEDAKGVAPSSPAKIQPKMRPQPPPGKGPPPQPPPPPPMDMESMHRPTPASGHKVPETPEMTPTKLTTPEETSTSETSKSDTSTCKRPRDVQNTKAPEVPGVHAEVQARPKQRAEGFNPAHVKATASKAVTAVPQDANEKGSVKQKAKGAATRSPSTQPSKKKEQRKASKQEKANKQKSKTKDKKREKDSKDKVTKKRCRSSVSPSPSPTCS